VDKTNGPTSLFANMIDMGIPGQPVSQPNAKEFG
jgi:hypothetical protein